MSLTEQWFIRRRRWLKHAQCMSDDRPLRNALFSESSSDLKRFSRSQFITWFKNMKS